MAHPYQQYREKHPGQKRAKERVRGFASGGSVSKDASIGKKALALHSAEHKELKAEGKKDGGRLDKYARGGKTKGKKGGHTKINIMVAPKLGNEAPPPVPPAAMGAAPPPMPPKMPLGPPAGGPMGGPMGGPPMKRGGKVGMKAGADSGEGRLQKARAYKR
jgi:hypothetical protein